MIFRCIDWMEFFELLLLYVRSGARFFQPSRNASANCVPIESIFLILLGIFPETRVQKIISFGPLILSLRL